MDRATTAIVNLTKTHYLFFLPPFLAFGRPNKSSIDFFLFLIFSTSALSFKNFNSFMLKGMLNNGDVAHIPPLAIVLTPWYGVCRLKKMGLGIASQ